VTNLFFSYLDPLNVISIKLTSKFMQGHLTVRHEKSYPFPPSTAGVR
jgi:hypothetical protein